MIHRAIQSLARHRFPGQDEVSRWSIGRAPIPDGYDALVHLTIEELAVNELRETFHHWVRTLRLPLRDGRLAEALDHVPARHLPAATSGTADDASELVEEAFDLWEGAEDDLEAVLELHAEQLTEQLAAQFGEDRERALAQETERYQSRQGEISALIEGSTLAKLDREIADLQEERKQGRLDYAAYQIDELERDIEQRHVELRRRKRHYEEVREELRRERERIVGELIPKRYALRGNAQALPLSVEILLPEVTT